MTKYLNISLLIGFVLGGIVALPVGFGLGTYYLPILVASEGPAMRWSQQRNLTR